MIQTKNNQELFVSHNVRNPTYISVLLLITLQPPTLISPQGPFCVQKMVFMAKKKRERAYLKAA